MSYLSNLSKRVFSEVKDLCPGESVDTTILHEGELTGWETLKVKELVGSDHMVGFKGQFFLLTDEGLLKVMPFLAYLCAEDSDTELIINVARQIALRNSQETSLWEVSVDTYELLLRTCHRHLAACRTFDSLDSVWEESELPFWLVSLLGTLRPKETS